MGLKKGYIQVYTGDGKGKTTAALGLAVRAAGANMKVYIGQFIKKGFYSEIKGLKRYKSHIKIEQFGRRCFIRGRPRKEDIEAAEKGLARVKSVIKSGRYSVVILDEINVALYFGLLDAKDVAAVLERRPKGVEIILTGRNAPKSILRIAHLVTEMKASRHYYRNGVKNRLGIDS